MFSRKEPEKRSIHEIFDREEDSKNDLDYVGDISEEYDLNDDCEKDHVENEKINPFDCFGIEEEKTEKWLVKCVKVWFCFMSFMWFLFGALTFAPIIYISNKVNVIFKDKTKSLLISSIFYSLFMILLAVFLF